LASFCEHPTPLACSSEKTRAVHADLIYAGIIIIALAEKVGNSLPRLMFPLVSRAPGVVENEGRVLASRNRCASQFGHRPDLLEMEQSNVHASAFDLER
jgi:hypothetical protein